MAAGSIASDKVTTPTPPPAPVVRPGLRRAPRRLAPLCLAFLAIVALLSGCQEDDSERLARRDVARRVEAMEQQADPHAKHPDGVASVEATTVEPRITEPLQPGETTGVPPEGPALPDQAAPAAPDQPRSTAILERAARHARGPMRQLPREFFGVQMHSVRSDSKAFPAGDIRRHDSWVETAEGLGARVVRDECPWDAVEAKKGKLVMPAVARTNFAINKRLGLETILILNYANPHYDGGKAPTSPEAIKAYAEYCGYMARELRGVVSIFEIWNEPNSDGFWKPRSDPVAYARLARAATAEIRRANPQAIVLIGATSQIDADFLEEVARNGGCDGANAISIHPYCTPRSPGEARIFPAIRAAAERASRARAAGSNAPVAGGTLPVWITEFGFPTAGANSVTTWRQAELVAQTLLLGAATDGIDHLTYYWLGPDKPESEDSEDRFGLFTQHDAPQVETPGARSALTTGLPKKTVRKPLRKPAAYAYDVLAHTLAEGYVSTRIASIDRIPDSVRIEGALATGEAFTALFTEKTRAIVEVKTTDPLRVDLLDGQGPVLLGGPKSGSPNSIWVEVSPRPLLLIESRESMDIRKAPAPLLITRWDGASNEAASRIRILPEQGRTQVSVGDTVLWQLHTEKSAMPVAASFDLRMSDAARAFLSLRKEDRDGKIWVATTGSTTDDRVPWSVVVRAGPNNDPFAILTPETAIADPIDVQLSARWRTPDGPPSGDPALVPYLRAEIQSNSPKNFEFSYEFHNPGAVVRPRAAAPKSTTPAPTPALALLTAKPGESLRLRLEGFDFPSTDVLHAEFRASNKTPRTDANWSRTFKDPLSWFVIPRLAAAPRIDGDLAEWPADAPHIDLAREAQVISSSEKWGGPVDASARVWLGWTPEGLYLAAEVRDDKFVEDNGTEGSEKVYFNDGLELYVDADRAAGRRAHRYTGRQYQYALYPSRGKDFALRMSPGDDQLGPTSATMKLNRKPTAAQRYRPRPANRADAARPVPSYIVEARIPMQELRISPRAGLEIGFTVALTDDDSPGSNHPFYQDAQLQWSRLPNAWQNPSSFTSVWLGNERARLTASTAPADDTGPAELLVTATATPTPTPRVTPTGSPVAAINRSQQSPTRTPATSPTKTQAAPAKTSGTSRPAATAAAPATGATHGPPPPPPATTIYIQPKTPRPSPTPAATNSTTRTSSAAKP